MADWQPTICIYHGHCDDGFGAAWAIRKRWPLCAFVPGHYGKPLPDVTDKDVLFVDFSAPYEVLVDLSFTARSLVVLDHHKTAQEGLQRLPPFDGTLTGLDKAFQINWTQNIPKIAVCFDMNRSGARMAWEFAHGLDEANGTVPAMIAYIEDRDLWRFALGEDTRKFSAALRTFPQTFEVWDEIARKPNSLIDDGEAILRAHRSNLRKFTSEVYLVEIAGHSVPVVNVPYHYASDAAHELLEQHPQAPFAAAWFRRADGMVQWSLRSEDNRLDVSEVAKRFGGGGHRNAAGFQQEAGCAEVVLRDFVTEIRAYQSPECDECDILGPLKRADAVLGEVIANG